MLKETILALAIQCAPQVTPDTIYRIAVAESAQNPIAINVNKLDGKIFRFSAPKTKEETVQVAITAMALGHSVDLGLMQINSMHLQRFGLSLHDLLNPCVNIKVGGEIIKEYYLQAVKKFGPGQQALLAALSGYNTGSLSQGFTNGYVNRYVTSIEPRTNQFIGGGQSISESSADDLLRALTARTKISFGDFYASKRTDSNGDSE